MNELSKFIKIVKAPLDNTTVAELLKYLDAQKEFAAATTIGDPKGEGPNKGGKIRKVNELNFTKYNKSMTHVHWHNLLCATISGQAEAYRSNYAEMAAMRLTHLSALKYTKSGHYIFHVDHCVDAPRTLSVIYLLNNDYKGGDLVFNLADKHFKIEKTPNTMILWPSNHIYPHKVEPVTEGVRYSLVSWLL
jgi:predicted 2-oxoglutarate/Fe(II)-dependent dioxygenase YbiX